MGIYRDRRGDPHKGQDVLFVFYLYHCLYRWFGFKVSDGTKKMLVEVTFLIPPTKCLVLGGFGHYRVPLRPSFPTLILMSIAV